MTSAIRDTQAGASRDTQPIDMFDTSGTNNHSPRAEGSTKQTLSPHFRCSIRVFVDLQHLLHGGAQPRYVAIAGGDLTVPNCVGWGP